MKKTTVVKLWGGPGVGKTTVALRLAGELSIQVGPKKSVEYVGEYAKHVIWQEKQYLLRHQPTITKGQLQMLAPIGKCDFIVTDSPVELGLLYSSTDEDSQKAKEMMDVHKKQNPQTEIHFFLKRDRNDFQNEGRIHTLEQSLEKDEEVLMFLEENAILAHTVSNTISPSDLCRKILQISA